MATETHLTQKTAPQQVAALPVLRGVDGPLVMLVTSRGTGRWVLPKGWPKKHLSGAETAALEAFEEAGLIGDIAEDAVGIFHYLKRMNSGATVQCAVEVFPLCVVEVLEEWPERTQRRREWFTLTEAAGLVREADLTALLLRLAASGALC